MKMKNKETLPRTVYKKLKHLHQVQWDTYSTFSHAPGSDTTGVWEVNVIVPSRDTTYVWHSANNQLQLISIKDKKNIIKCSNYDFKHFIRVIKKVLRRKSCVLNYEGYCQ